MGAIWQAEHLALQAPVAVKLIDRDAITDEQTMARFLREAKAAAALRSPHVVHIMDYGMDDGLPFIVMELLEGETLSQRLKRRGRLSPAETALIATHVGRAMTRAHEAGIVHRDLKPENVFLVQNEDEEIAKVLDFGVAKILERSELVLDGEQTRTGSILGTPYYMSPEQAQGNKTVDYRTDLWALGVMVYECLLGKRPFYSDGLGDLVLQICIRDLPVPSEQGDVPLGFDAWFARAVNRDVEQRFQSARELTDALREAFGFEPRSVLPDGLISQVDPYELEGARSSSRSGSREAPSFPTASRERFEAVTRNSAAAIPTRADPIAATMAAPPKSSPSIEALTPATPSVPPAGSHLTWVVAVAAAALGIGIGGGALAIRKLQTQPDPAPTIAAPEPAATASSRKPRRPQDRLDAGLEPQPTLPQLAEPAPSASALAPTPAAAKSKPEPATTHNAAPVPLVDAGAPAPPSNASPDGGWVKPAWAIPDENIPPRIDGPRDLP